MEVIKRAGALLGEEMGKGSDQGGRRGYVSGWGGEWTSFRFIELMLEC
jgi:hypothetical protein